mgnify:FL=1
MSKRGDHAMLVTDSFDLHMLMAQYLLAVKSNKLLYLRSCQWHRFAFAMYCCCNYLSNDSGVLYAGPSLTELAKARSCSMAVFAETICSRTRSGDVPPLPLRAETEPRWIALRALREPCRPEGIP